MSNLERIEADLARARDAIRKAVQAKNHSKGNDDQGFIPTGSIYRNAHSFHQLSFTYICVPSFLSVSFSV